ncbi:MAG: glutathione S-transferase N-terminal domain-containing protein [Gammaproteobacteria bacterium]|nr:glutathione S-transferase N-terminal domain-containing protein [Gammaproteobacteria bacterium]
MLKFYYSGAPNPMKVALFLEESGLEYEAIPVDTRKGDQHAPGYLAVNPNAKVPAIVDGDTTVFDSNAILLYLAEKTGQFLPKNQSARGDLLSWLMFVASGIGPYSGQAVHFTRYAPEPLPYAIGRYRFEAERHYGLIEQRLTDRAYMVDDTYTIVDMALWGWARLVPMVMGDHAWEGLPHLKRFVDEIEYRPAAARALAIKDQHQFKTEMDEEAERAMFPGNARLAK